jgi:hypothetical protein
VRIMFGIFGIFAAENLRCAMQTDVACAMGEVHQGKNNLQTGNADLPSGNRGLTDKENEQNNDFRQ